MSRRTLAAVQALPERVVVGLMSGTSMDGLDIAWCRIGAGARPSATLLDFSTVAFPPELHARLHAAPEAITAEIARLDMDLGRFMADAVAAAASRTGLVAELVGSHGQTVWHEHGATTLQIGDPGPLAAALACPVIDDFRRNDLAVGGCGAPLVPICDRMLLARPGVGVIAVNIGGISNLTAVPPADAADRTLQGFDCGPGNMVIDELVRLATDGAMAFDEDGRFASRGRVDEALLEVLLGHRFFGTAPPRSAGREQFGRGWTADLVRGVAPDDPQAWCDLIATATELTAAGIAHSIALHVAAPWPIGAVALSGGGARNPQLVRRIAARLAPLEVTTTDALGLPGDAKEAIAFALLASLRVDGLPGNVPEVTGARREVLLGRITEI